MATRRYLSFSIDRLEQEFNGLHDIQAVKSVLEELAYRKTTRARKLQARAEVRLNELSRSKNIDKLRTSSHSRTTADRSRTKAAQQARPSSIADPDPGDRKLRKRLEDADKALARARQSEEELHQRVLQLRHQIEAEQDARSEDMAHARYREQQLQLLLGRAQIELAQLRNIDNDTRLFASVGLHPSCPKELIIHVQRFWRKQWHPDSWTGRPDRERISAEEKFKEIDQAFSQIERRRGLS